MIEVNIIGSSCPMWALEHCIISPPCFLVECHKRRLNQASFVCVVCLFGSCLVSVFCLYFNLSSVLYFPACTNMNGTV